MRSFAESSSPVISTTEWRVRVELAAAHRIANVQGLNEGIFNHFTVNVPGKPGRFYVIPFGLHWSEAKASQILEVDYDGNVVSGEGDCERSAYCIHAPIHKLNPDATCVFHTHMPFASALTRLENGRLEPTGQTEASLAGMSAYDDIYTGLALDPAEGARLAGVLGDKKILFMANHGVLVIGKTVAQTYDRLYYLERAAQVQIYAMSTGRTLKYIPEAVVEHTREQFRNAPQYGGRPAYEIHFDALMRVLDKSGTDYKN